jgi:hypothetical protein
MAGPQTAIYKTRSGLMKRVKHVLPQFLQQEQISSRTNARARLLMESTIEAQFRSVLSQDAQITTLELEGEIIDFI